MNDADSSIEVKARLALSNLKRRERLLKIIRGKPEWFYLMVAVLWAIFILYVSHSEMADNKTALLLLMPLGFLIIGLYLVASRRIDALLELIGEENLGNLKKDDKEQQA